MNDLYRFTPYALPMLAAAVFNAALGVYSFRHRKLPGALPFSIMMVFAVLWALGAALELAAVNLETKIFWFKFQGVWKIPIATAELVFALQYTRLDRFLIRRNLFLFSFLPVLTLILVLTNDIHHQIWSGFGFDNEIYPLRTDLVWILYGYVYLLGIAVFAIFIHHFILSPQHRWLVVFILSVFLVNRFATTYDLIGMNLFTPMDPVVLSWTITTLIYAVALFGFHMFDPIPIGRKTVIEQMRDGMLMLDTGSKIVDLNPAAEKITGVSAEYAIGRMVSEVLPSIAENGDLLLDSGVAKSEITLGSDRAAGIFMLQRSPLKDAHDNWIGHLILLQDISEQKRSQAQLLEQQRAVAILQERERLARELHDNLGQVLGYVSMQAQAVVKWMREGKFSLAESQLIRLADVAQEAHIDLREAILSLKTGQSQEWSFLAALRQHLDSFQNNYGIRTELLIPPEVGEENFDPEKGVQLLRVIQEALTNARKHGQARCIQITYEQKDGAVCFVIADDGCGFDPERLAGAAGDHFGLAFMRERIEQFGGYLEIESQPGAGTRVLIQAPVFQRQELQVE